MLQGMADNGIDIPASLDGAMYNTFAGNQDYIFQGSGNEFSITRPVGTLTVTLSTGKGIVCGRTVQEHTSEGTNTSIQIEPNTSGYIVIRADLTKTAGNEFYLTTTNEIVAQDINGSGTIHDLPLYQYTADASSVTNWLDVRKIVTAGNSSAPILYTMLASAWQDDIYTINNAQIKHNNRIDVSPQLSATRTQYLSWLGATLQPIAQEDGYIRVQALGKKPTIDIPIQLLISG